MSPGAVLDVALENIEKLADALHLPLSELFAGVEEQRKTDED